MPAGAGVLPRCSISYLVFTCLNMHSEHNPEHHIMPRTRVCSYLSASRLLQNELEFSVTGNYEFHTLCLWNNGIYTSGIILHTDS